jgi:RNA recognition motif-containing protein
MRGEALTIPSFNVTPEELFDLFGKFGPVRYVHLSLRPPSLSRSPEEQH